ncbi:MAG: tRNA (N6-threonylcarbamoyladenosine(37)-N6)-methyltransferase TrmO [Bacteroidales bacterium]|nr:tRNA (N6-threonylcarbamoyladenosine(37)-N6)-methyltransferase TrmO [Bacteroidales bacterium]
MKNITYKPIGIIHSPYDTIHGMPIQPSAARGIKGTIEIFDDYCRGLKDLNGFSHIILLYHFHLSDDYKLIVKPFLDNKQRGVFATRAPRRPNPIGLSVVKLNKINNNILHIEKVDIVNNTPLLDIKPYIPDFEKNENIRIGWLSGSKHKFSSAQADDRFDC